MLEPERDEQGRPIVATGRLCGHTGERDGGDGDAALFGRVRNIRGAAPDEMVTLLLAQRYITNLAKTLPTTSIMAEAWEEFFRVHVPLIRGVVRAYRSTAIDLDDATQEIWQTVVSCLPDFNYDDRRGDFRSWLFTVARNRLADLSRQADLRKAERIEEVLGTLASMSDDNPEVVCDRHLTQEMVGEVLDEFRTLVSDKNFRIVLSRWMDGHSVAEIASELRISREQVRVRHHRMMKKLRLIVQDRTARHLAMAPR